MSRRLIWWTPLLAALLWAAAALPAAPAGAQRVTLEAQVAVWVEADGSIELCLDLTHAPTAGETAEARVCPARNQLDPAAAPADRWLRSREAPIGPEMALYVRVRRIGDWLQLGFVSSFEGVRTAHRRAYWTLNFTTAEPHRWHQTDPLTLTLPASPHPELWERPGLAPGAERLTLHERVPDFQLPQLDGEATEWISLTAARNDGAALIVFWSSWAPYAADMLAELDALAAAEGLTVVAVNVYELNPAEAARLASSAAAATLHLSDAGGEVARHYQVDGLPEVYIIDANGTYQAAVRGAAPRSTIQAALHEARTP